MGLALTDVIRTSPLKRGFLESLEGNIDSIRESEASLTGCPPELAELNGNLGPLDKAIILHLFYEENILPERSDDEGDMERTPFSASAILMTSIENDFREKLPDFAVPIFEMVRGTNQYFDLGGIVREQLGRIGPDGFREALSETRSLVTGYHRMLGSAFKEVQSIDSDYQRPIVKHILNNSQSATITHFGRHMTRLDNHLSLIEFFGADSFYGLDPYDPDIKSMDFKPNSIRYRQHTGGEMVMGIITRKQGSYSVRYIDREGKSLPEDRQTELKLGFLKLIDHESSHTMSDDGISYRSIMHFSYFGMPVDVTLAERRMLLPYWKVGENEEGEDIMAVNPHEREAIIHNAHIEQQRLLREGRDYREFNQVREEVRGL